MKDSEESRCSKAEHFKSDVEPLCEDIIRNERISSMVCLGAWITATESHRHAGCAFGIPTVALSIALQEGKFHRPVNRKAVYITEYVRCRDRTS
jgi:hypothetical protein